MFTSELSAAEANVDAMKKQAEGTNAEYDRLLKENATLQVSTPTELELNFVPIQIDICHHVYREQGKYFIMEHSGLTTEQCVLGKRICQNCDSLNSLFFKGLQCRSAYYYSFKCTMII